MKMSGSVESGWGEGVYIDGDCGSRFRTDIQWGHERRVESEIAFCLLERWTDGDAGG